MDSIMVERLWRTIKYEHVYLKSARMVKICMLYLDLFEYYNIDRGHSSLNNLTPFEVHF